MWHLPVEYTAAYETKEHTKVSGMTPVRVAPGQSRPIKFKVLQIASGGEVLDLKFHYRREDWEVTVLVEKPLNFVENCYQPQKYT